MPGYPGAPEFIRATWAHCFRNRRDHPLAKNSFWDWVRSPLNTSFYLCFPFKTPKVLLLNAVIWNVSNAKNLHLLSGSLHFVFLTLPPFWKKRPVLKGKWGKNIKKRKMPKMTWGPIWVPKVVFLGVLGASLGGGITGASRWLLTPFLVNIFFHNHNLYS